MVILIVLSLISVILLIVVNMKFKVKNGYILWEVIMLIIIV